MVHNDTNKYTDGTKRKVKIFYMLPKPRIFSCFLVYGFNEDPHKLPQHFPSAMILPCLPEIAGNNNAGKRLKQLMLTLFDCEI